MGNALNVVKNVMIKVVKSEAFKVGVTCAAAGAGTILGFAAGAGIASTVESVKDKIKNRKNKKGLTEEDSEKTEEVFEQKEA